MLYHAYQAYADASEPVRAMAELFLASLGGIRLLPCLLEVGTLEKKKKFARLPSLEAALYLAARLGDGRFAELAATIEMPAPLSVERSAPRAGDHLLFPAIVWDPAHTTLFRQLTDEGVQVSILLHDLSPLEGSRERAPFLDWLQTALSLAGLVFVPNETVPDGLLAQQSRTGAGRENVVCVLLGRGASDAKVDHWLREAAPVEGFVGFAIGRSIWWDALKGFLDGSVSREDAQTAAAALYRSLGFAAFGREPNALKIGDRYLDEEYMVLRLANPGNQPA